MTHSPTFCNVHLNIKIKKIPRIFEHFIYWLEHGGRAKLKLANKPKTARLDPSR